ncbi:DMT family transporter [Caballeronia sp. LP006]|jgi:drug/metabolite transporter (DMT)-like permease|uniref:DMT family transporter n=1 Tax=unclassified Caballeronia TaxID=2646786 RepID=UPI002029581E|nr:MULTISPECIES: DMT family transporter [unclassified Caballeronia]MDR5771124.1 DMT family transporter [Caballeronia sp. LZ002]MDR5802385.1 DMT family transporter [Caballeronia sp. LZ001]MDR5830833.1 DMT family transporter [Caballeronia sp. LP006]MDR5846561.1 DMT family transporter [Caballeronia sp. LZ003]
MSPVNLLQLVCLAALWGASFLFIRVGVAEFGVAPLMALRVGIGAVFLVAMLLGRRQFSSSLAIMRKRALPLLIVGILNSAAPFCLFAYAELTLSAGATSVINATTPLWGALVAYLWLKDRLTTLRTIGTAIGFAGVLLLVWNQIEGSPGSAGSGAAGVLAAAAALAASALYGVAGNFAKKYLMDVDAMTNAAGSMIGATLVLAPIAFVTWPAAPVSAPAWAAVLALGVGCTGIAYFIYYHLVAVVGPARAMTVTFVIPLFGILWGALFLHERVSLVMLEGCAVVLAGTALATGAIKRLPFSGRRKLVG